MAGNHHLGDLGAPADLEWGLAMIDQIAFTSPR